MLQYSYITLLLKRQNLTLSACYIPLIPFFHIILLLEYWDMLLSGYSINMLLCQGHIMLLCPYVIVPIGYCNVTLKY